MPAPHEPRVVRVAAMIADATRARMLSYLLGGELASASELARCATVSAATASAHLAKLLDAGLVVCTPRGRHRYYALADAEVAHALEALALVAERGCHTSAWAPPARARLREARSCYGHLAGRAGVALLTHLQAQQWLELESGAGGPQFRLSDTGRQGLSDWGLDGTAWQAKLATSGPKRQAYPCLDWSERRDHLAGPLASTLLSHFLERHWLYRAPSDRALSLTPAGRCALGWWPV
ncbi:helix-turn-helix transcriptional regulator [Ideonella sp. DXS29W]|uniref:Helix-turn-helix transcriptional regulator n=1 Tax=Ideonella lacteola TaxID=2984193 RepID=A0ABU9BX94_9BURK